MTYEKKTKSLLIFVSNILTLMYILANHCSRVRWSTVTCTEPLPPPTAKMSLFRSLESLMEGHNWFYKQFVEILRVIYIIVYFLSLLTKAGLNLTPFEISCS
jgi:hypothetical protein